MSENLIVKVKIIKFLEENINMCEICINNCNRTIIFILMSNNINLKII